MKPKIVIEIKNGAVNYIVANCEMDTIEINRDGGHIVHESFGPDAVYPQISDAYDGEPDIQEQLKQMGF